MIKKIAKLFTFFGFIFFIFNSVSFGSEFDNYRTDAEMQCWGDQGPVLFIVKGDKLIMQLPDDVMSWKLGQGLKRNGEKLEFIADAGFFKFYVNFENRTASGAGFPFQCM